MDLGAGLHALAAVNPATGTVRLPGCGEGPRESDYHAGQWRWITTTALRALLKCGRQWGKTTANRGRAHRNIARARRTLYVAMVRANAREQFWRPLQGILAEHGWSMDANETDLIMRAPNGGLVKVWSADDVRDIEKGRGYQWDDVLLDEPQSFPEDVLRPLLDMVIIPTLFKTGGSLGMSGTPPDTLVGYFVEAWKSGKWERHGGPIFENPHIPRANVIEAYAARGIGPGHPIWEREVLGEMVLDPSKLAYEYDESRNAYVLTDVDFTEGPWRHAMGIDLGFQDNDAIVVVAWRRDDPERRLYQRYAWAANHQDVDQLAAKVREVLGMFRCSWIVGDHGGHGATKVLETLKSRLGIQIMTKPVDVMVSVGLVNDDLRTGRLKIASPELAGDLGRVTRTVNPNTKRVEINKKGFHSDLTEALRYAHSAAHHYRSRAPKPEETEPADVWARRERDERRQAEAARRRFPWQR